MKSYSQILNEFEAKLREIPDAQKRVEEIIEFTTIYGDSYGEKIMYLLEDGIQLSRQINFSAGEIICYYNLLFFQALTRGAARHSRADMPNPEETLEKLKGDVYWYSLGMNLLAYHHWFRGEYEKGFNMAFDAVKYTEQVHDRNTGWHYFALGVFYFDTKDYENSKIYYRLAYDSFVKFGHSYGKARAGNGLASIAIYQQQIDIAIPLLEESSHLYRECGHHSGLSRAINDMALIEKVRKNYPHAIELFNEAIELRKEINHLQGLITSLTELGEIYIELNEHTKALELLQTALEYSQKAESRQKSMRLNKLLYDLHKKLNNIPLALHYFETFYDLKTQLMGDEASNNIKRLQTNFEKEKSEQQAEIERLKNVELKKAYEIIEQRNKDIHDSINYASRIQRSLLPSERNIQKMLEQIKK